MENTIYHSMDVDYQQFFKNNELKLKETQPDVYCQKAES